MSTPALTREQWVEIYYALDLKAGMVGLEAYGKDKRWVEDLRAIQEIIGPDGENMVTP